MRLAAYRRQRSLPENRSPTLACQTSDQRLFVRTAYPLYSRAIFTSSHCYCRPRICNLNLPLFPSGFHSANVEFDEVERKRAVRTEHSFFANLTFYRNCNSFPRSRSFFILRSFPRFDRKFRRIRRDENYQTRGIEIRQWPLKREWHEIPDGRT